MVNDFIEVLKINSKDVEPKKSYSSLSVFVILHSLITGKCIFWFGFILFVLLLS